MPKPGETYGECKLGGFQWAKVTGLVGGNVAVADRVVDAPREKQFYWAPVSVFWSRFLISRQELTLQGNL
jgi:hypothetical protein